MNAVEVRALAKRFGSFQALAGVSFAVEPGEAFALLGPNGSGKTTTLKAIAGLVPPASGQVLVEGVDVWRNPRDAKRRFSYLPQRVAFPENLTAREVLAFYSRLRRVPAERAAAALTRAGLDGAECSSKPVGAFSGGMTQRLGIAVALLAGAGILILDEPTASLDPVGAARFLETLAHLQRGGLTLIFSSHVLADVETLAGRVALLLEGRLVAIDRVRDLRRTLSRPASTRVVLAHPDETAVRVLRRAGATDIAREGNILRFSAESEDRISILRALEAAGCPVESFSTEAASLQEIYLRYIYETSRDPRAAEPGCLPQRAAAAD